MASGFTCRSISASGKWQHLIHCCDRAGRTIALLSFTLNWKSLPPYYLTDERFCKPVIWGFTLEEGFGEKVWNRVVRWKSAHKLTLFWEARELQLINFGGPGWQSTVQCSFHLCVQQPYFRAVQSQQSSFMRPKKKLTFALPIAGSYNICKAPRHTVYRQITSKCQCEDQIPFPKLH